MNFSLIIPCYNEAENLPLLISRCKALVENPLCEVILVDNGSTDSTPMVLNSLLITEYSGIRSIRVEKNQGYGFGILSGLKAAKGNILGWTHADLQTNPLDFLQALTFFEKGHKIFVKGKRYGRKFSDVIFTIGMSLFETFLLRKFLWDINAQPTVFSRHFFETWKNSPHDFSLDLYAYYTAKRAGLKVFRFPVQFGKRAYGVSHWNINWTAKIKFIKRTMKFSFELRKSVQNKVV